MLSNFCKWESSTTIYFFTLHERGGKFTLYKVDFYLAFILKEAGKKNK